MTIAPANGDGKTSYTVRLYDTASKTTLLDTQTIPVVFKGASGINAINASLSTRHIPSQLPTAAWYLTTQAQAQRYGYMRERQSWYMTEERGMVHMERYGGEWSDGFFTDQVYCTVR